MLGGSLLHSATLPLPLDFCLRNSNMSPCACSLIQNDSGSLPLIERMKDYIIPAISRLVRGADHSTAYQEEATALYSSVLILYNSGTKVATCINYGSIQPRTMHSDDRFCQARLSSAGIWTSQLSQHGRDSQSQGNFSTSQNSHTFEVENFEGIKQSLRCEGGFVDVLAELALRIFALQASPHLVSLGPEIRRAAAADRPAYCPGTGVGTEAASLPLRIFLTTEPTH